MGLFRTPPLAAAHTPAAQTSVPLEAESELPAALGRFITRVPLLDTDYHIVGYELRIRPCVPLPVIPGAADVQQIQDEALLASVIDLDFQRALGDKLTLLALDAASLHSPLLEQLAGERVLLVAPPAAPGDTTAQRCVELAERGFRLVVDEPFDPWPQAAPLPSGPLARIDSRRHDAAALTRRAAATRRLGATELIANHVDSLETYEACRQLPFRLLQGYFYTQAAATSRPIHASRLHIVELLNLVMSHAEFPQIEARFKLDVALSYKLLRYINSPAVGLRYPIKSIGQALVMLGHDQLYRWLTLLMFTHDAADRRAQALLKHALVRARLTETLGQAHVPKGQRGGLFIVAILSMLDALLALPLDQAIAQLRLPEEVVDALLHGQGILSPYLRLAQACEQLDQEVVQTLSASAGLTPEAVNLAHVNALIWSESLAA